MLSLVSRKDYTGLADYLNVEIERLAKAGADFAVLASNTPHIVFDRLQNKSGIPLVSIVNETVKYAKNHGLNRLGLFGTKSTMQNSFYQDGFAKENIKIFTPSVNSQDYINEKYMNELVKGIFLQDTKKEFVGIAQNLIKENQIEGLVLGGTELPFILEENDFKHLVLLNTTDIHVQSILDYALKN